MVQVAASVGQGSLETFLKLVDGRVESRERSSPEYRVDGISPRSAVFPKTVDEVAIAAGCAARAALAVIPIGGNTHLSIGRVPHRYDLALVMSGLNRIIAHESADLTVSVEAGRTLASLNEVLGSAEQQLSLDPSQQEKRTIGGIIATDANGPLRYRYGKVRDLLIGTKVVSAEGTIVKSGGQVVKNVAGYDLNKLWIGSYGSLAAIVEATFRVHPRPRVLATLMRQLASERECLELALKLVQEGAEAVAMTSFNAAAARQKGFGDSPTLVVAVPSATSDLLATGFATPAPNKTSHFQALEALAPADEGNFGFRLSTSMSKLPSLLLYIEEQSRITGVTAAISIFPGNGIICFRTDADNREAIELADRIRHRAATDNAAFIFDQLDHELKERIDPWASDVSALSVMRKIKKSFDPLATWSPGRFVSGI